MVRIGNKKIRRQIMACMLATTMVTSLDGFQGMQVLTAQAEAVDGESQDSTEVSVQATDVKGTSATLTVNNADSSAVYYVDKDTYEAIDKEGSETVSAAAIIAKVSDTKDSGDNSKSAGSVESYSSGLELTGLTVETAYTYYVVVKTGDGTEESDYTIQEVTFTTTKMNLQIQSGTLTGTITYGASFPASLTVDGVTVQDESGTTVSGTWAKTDSSDTSLPAGGEQTCSYTFTATENSDNYKTLKADATITVEQATPTVTVEGDENSEISYTGKAVSHTATVTGVDVEGAAKPSGEVTYTYYQDNSGSKSETKTQTSDGAASEGAAPVNAGTYWVVASYPGDTNYANADSAATKFTITKNSDYSLSMQGTITKQYTGEAQISISEVTEDSETGYKSDLDETPTFTFYTDENLQTKTTSDNAGASDEGGEPTKVGTYYVTASYVAGDNYEAKTGNGYLTYVIEAADQTISVSGEGVTTDENGVITLTKTYGDADVTLSNIVSVSKPSENGGALSYELTDNSDECVTLDGASGSEGLKISAAGEATLTIKAAETADGNYKETTKTVTIKVNPATPTISYTADENASYVYDGTAKSILGTAVVTGISDQTLNDCEVTYTYYTDSSCSQKTTDADGAEAEGGAPKNAGTYYVKATVAAQENYGEATTANAASYTIAKATPTLTLQNKIADYTGSAVEVDKATVEGVTGGEAPTGTVTYTYYTNEECTTATSSENSGATASGGAPVNAGTYYVKASIAADGNYSDATSEAATVTISKVNAEVDMTGKVTKEYVANRTEAGIGKYVEGSDEGGYISNLDEAPTFTFYTDSSCADECKTSTVSGGALSEGGVPTAVGTYYVKASYADTDNYGAATSENYLVYEIVAAKQTLTASGNDVTITEGEYTFTKTYGAEAVSCSAITVTSAEVSGATFTYALENEQNDVVALSEDKESIIFKNAGEAILLVTAAASSDGNYAATTLKVTIKVAQAEVTISTEPVANPATVTYGAILSDIALEGGQAEAGDKEISGTFAWKDATVKPTPGNTSGYTVVFTPADTNYAPKECSVNVTVNKAAAPTQPDLTIQTTTGDTVGDVTIPTTGWSWSEEDASKALVVGQTVTASAIYTAADAEYYEGGKEVVISITKLTSCEGGSGSEEGSGSCSGSSSGSTGGSGSSSGGSGSTGGSGSGDTSTPGSGDTNPGTGDNKPGSDTETPGTGDNKPGSDTETPGTGDNKPGSDTETPGTGDENVTKLPTETVTNEDGTTTTTDVTITETADGTKTEEKVETKKDAEGNVICKTETTTVEKTDAQTGVSSKDVTEVVKDAEGKVTQTVETMEATDAANTVTLVTTKTTDADGSVVENKAELTVNKAESKTSSSGKVAVTVEIPMEVLAKATSGENGKKADVAIVLSQDTVKNAMTTNGKKAKGCEISISIPTTDTAQVNSIVVPKETFKELANNNSSTTKLNITNGNTKYSITMTNDQAKKYSKEKQVDFAVETSTASEKKAEDATFKKVASQAPANSTVISFAETGKLPAGMKLTMKVTTDTVKAKKFSLSNIRAFASTTIKAGKTVYVYRYDTKSKKLLEIPNSKKTVSANGNISLDAKYGGSYVVSTKKLSKATTLASKIKVKVGKTTLKKGKKTTMKVTLPSNLKKVSKFVATSKYFGQEQVKLTYTSSKKSVATVSKSGVIKAKKKGTATIKVVVTFKGGTKKSFTKKIKVK